MAKKKQLSKAEKLRIGGTLAPVVRKREGERRRVVIVDSAGKPVRETTLADVQAALARRHDIEFAGRLAWLNLV